MKKYNTVTLIGTIAFLFVVIVYATYAYVNPVTDLQDLNIAADISSPLAFTATGGNNFDLYVDMESMTPDKANNVVAESTDNIVISLDTDGMEGICCNYTIDWVWDETDVVANQYSISEGATNEYVLTGSMSETYLTSGGITASIGHSNPKFTEQIPNYDSSSLSTPMYYGTICNNTKYFTTHAEQKYTLNASFYNMPVVQDKFKGVSLNGSVKVANVSCIRNNDFDDAQIIGKPLSDAVIALANGQERPSGQANGGVYRVIEEKAILPDEDTYVTMTPDRFEDSVMYYSNDRSEAFNQDNVITNAFSFNSEGGWFNLPENQVEGLYYNLILPIRENGHYQICYNYSDSGRNYLSTYIVNSLDYTTSNDSVAHATMITSENNNTCDEIGFLSSGQTLKIVNYIYDNQLDTFKQMHFNIQKTTITRSDDAGIRYQGKDPDNYVLFNNEEWRIIGVFDGASLGLETGKKYTKIIRSEALKDYAYSTNDGHRWPYASLNSYLNDTYLYEIDELSRGMIENATYYVNDVGINFKVFNSSYFYKQERIATEVYNDVHENFLGLMYPSDYGFAMYAGKNNTICLNNNVFLSQYGTGSSQGCAEYDWLLLRDYEYTITSNDTASGVYGISENGSIELLSKTSGISVSRPVLYLENNILISSGDGTQENPYILSRSLPNKINSEFYICDSQYAGTEECKNHPPRNIWAGYCDGYEETYGYYYSGNGEITFNCIGQTCDEVTIIQNSESNTLVLGGACQMFSGREEKFVLEVIVSETDNYSANRYLHAGIHYYGHQDW